MDDHWMFSAKARRTKLLRFPRLISLMPSQMACRSSPCMCQIFFSLQQTITVSGQFSTPTCLAKASCSPFFETRKVMGFLICSRANFSSWEDRSLASEPSRKTMMQVFLVDLHNVSQFCLLRTAMSAWVAFSASLAVTHSRMDIFLLTPSYCVNSSTFLGPFLQKRMEGYLVSLNWSSKRWFSVSVMLILATRTLPLSSVLTNYHSLLRLMQAELLDSQKLMRKGSRDLRKAESQLSQSRRRVFDFFLSSSSSRHSLLARSFSLSWYSWKAFRDFASSAREAITLSNCSRAHPTILSASSSPSNTTGASRSSPYRLSVS